MINLDYLLVGKNKVGELNKNQDILVTNDEAHKSAGLWTSLGDLTMPFSCCLKKHNASPLFLHSICYTKDQDLYTRFSVNKALEKETHFQLTKLFDNI